jgi:hypothetical protein
MTCLDELTNKNDNLPGKNANTERWKNYYTIDTISAFKFRKLEHDFMINERRTAELGQKYENEYEIVLKKYKSLGNKFGEDENFILRVVGDAVRYDDKRNNGEKSNYSSSLIAFLFLSASKAWNKRTAVTSGYLLKYFKEEYEAFSIERYARKISDLTEKEEMYYGPTSKFIKMKKYYESNGPSDAADESEYEVPSIFQFYHRSSYFLFNGIFPIISAIWRNKANYLFPLYYKENEDIPKGIKLTFPEFVSTYYNTKGTSKNKNNERILTTGGMPLFFEKKPVDVLMNSLTLKTGGVTSKDPNNVAYVGKFRSFSKESDEDGTYVPISSSVYGFQKNEIDVENNSGQKSKSR